MSSTPVQALAARKVRRQKQVIAVGSVVLLAVLGFELPKMLGRGGSPTTAATSVVPSIPGSPPVAAAAARLPDTDRVVVVRDSDQLLSFGLFKSKDPFVQQLASPSSSDKDGGGQAKQGGTKSASSTKSNPGVGSSGPGAAVIPATTTTAETSPAPSNPPAGTEPSTTAPPSAPTSVLISTNGVCAAVALKGTFPRGEDIFRVVSIARDGKSVEIGVVGGSYDSGQASATLKLGGTLTLVNTADGTRYVIALKSKCDISEQPTRGTGTTTAPTTPVSPTPTTTTATTPIVTDSLDTTTTGSN